MTQLTDSHSVTVTELPDDALIDSTLSSLLDVYSDHGYDRGYTRATRDLLAIYPLLMEEFLHGRPDATPEIRRVIRDFAKFVEQRVDRPLPEVGFTEGAGI